MKPWPLAVSSQSKNVTRTTTTFGSIGGADIAFHSLAAGEDGLLIGALAGYSSSYARFSSGNPNARLYGPVTGLYASYYLGPFSTDLLLKADFFTLNDPALAPAENAVAQNDYTVAQNFNYRLPWAQYWIEPTIGYRYLNIVYNAGGSPGAQGKSWRVQGGLRVGRDALSWNGVLISWSLAALLYEDVALSGFAIDVGGALNSLSPFCRPTSISRDCSVSRRSTSIMATASAPSWRSMPEAARTSLAPVERLAFAIAGKGIKAHAALSFMSWLGACSPEFNVLGSCLGRRSERFPPLR